MKAILKGGPHDGRVIDIVSGQSGIKVACVEPTDYAIPIEDDTPKPPFGGSAKVDLACYGHTGDHTEAGLTIYRYFRDVKETI